MSRYGGRSEEGFCKLVIVILLRVLVTLPMRVMLKKIIDGFTVILDIKLLSLREILPLGRLSQWLQTLIGDPKCIFTKSLFEFFRCELSEKTVKCTQQSTRQTVLFPSSEYVIEGTLGILHIMLRHGRVEVIEDIKLNRA